jgi:hypothetical protein
VVHPQQGELEQFLTAHRAIGLRYSTSIDAPSGQVSYHALYDCERYGFDSLGKWARKNVRRGLRNCVVEPLPFERLAVEGWALQLDTLDRQGRNLRVARDIWEKRCLAAGDLPGFDAWGAFVDGVLAASVITFQMENCVYMLYQQCRREYLREHVNNALGFSVTQSVLRRPETDSILYGLHSLDAPSSVDEFKFRMGYRAKPVRQRVVFHPWLVPAAISAGHALLRWLLRRRPGSPTLAKAEGMFRFHLEGKRPLHEQHWPEGLADQKPGLLRQVGRST